MSDFLTSLVARAVAPPTLRPRARLLFEPADVEQPSPWTEEAGPSRSAIGAQEPERRADARKSDHAPHVEEPLVSQLHDESTQPPSSTPPNAPPRETPAVPLRLTERVVETRDVRVPVRVPVPMRVEVPRERTTVVHDSHREDGARHEATSAAPDREAEVQVQRVAMPASPAPKRIVRETEHRVVERHIETESRATREVRTTAHHTDAIETTRTIHAPSPPPRTIARVDRTAISLASRTRPASDAPQSPQPEAAPAVHVSIGRVEVRAITTPPAATRRARPQPMSIDEYVARREVKDKR